MAKLIYVGGFGRSGSTLLEYLLASHPGVLACGEVGRHPLKWRTRKGCTCGRQALECPVWAPFQFAPRKAERWDHERLTHALAEHAAASFTAMVDSSKTAGGSWRVPFQLRQRLSDSFVLMHIVRDPRAVCWSTIRTPLERRKKGRTVASGWNRCLRTAFGWLTANFVCEVFGKPGSVSETSLRGFGEVGAGNARSDFSTVGAAPRAEKTS